MSTKLPFDLAEAAGRRIVDQYIAESRTSWEKMTDRVVALAGDIDTAVATKAVIALTMAYLQQEAEKLAAEMER
jgi:hypothetical protein